MGLSVSLDDYRFGIIVGVAIGWGIHAILEGAEILVFGELVIPWNTTNAVISVFAGLAYLGLAYYCHNWYRSLRRVAVAEDGDHHA